MKLIIFDIDGTLTHSNTVDTQAFSAAVCDYLAIPEINTNWYEYSYSTDSGLLHEIFQRYLHCQPTSEDIESIKYTFVKNLQNSFLNDSQSCLPVKGIHELLNTLLKQDDIAVAIATGAWQVSADLKLAQAKLPYHNLPKAYAEDHFERTGIIRAAIVRSRQYYRQEDFQSLVYVGDRLWDQQAASKLNMKFVGVGEELCQHQDFVACSIPDYSDPQQFFQLIQ